MLEVCYVALITYVLLHFLISSLFLHVKSFSHHRCTQDFTMEGVHVVGGQATGSVGQKSPSGVHGKASVRDTNSPEAEAKCEISVQF